MTQRSGESDICVERRQGERLWKSRLVRSPRRELLRAENTPAHQDGKHVEVYGEGQYKDACASWWVMPSDLRCIWYGRRTPRSASQNDTHHVHIYQWHLVRVRYMRLEIQRQGGDRLLVVNERTRGYPQENNGRRRARAVVRYRRWHSLVEPQGCCATGRAGWEQGAARKCDGTDSEPVYDC